MKRSHSTETFLNIITGLGSVVIGLDIGRLGLAGWIGLIVMAAMTVLASLAVETLVLLNVHERSVLARALRLRR